MGFVLAASGAPGEGIWGAVGAERLEGEEEKEPPACGPAFQCHVPISEQPNVNFYDKNVN